MSSQSIKKLMVVLSGCIIAVLYFKVYTTWHGVIGLNENLKIENTELQTKLDECREEKQRERSLIELQEYKEKYAECDGTQKWLYRMVINATMYYHKHRRWHLASDIERIVMAAYNAEPRDKKEKAAFSVYDLIALAVLENDLTNNRGSLGEVGPYQLFFIEEAYDKTRELESAQALKKKLGYGPRTPNDNVEFQTDCVVYLLKKWQQQYGSFDEAIKRYNRNSVTRLQQFYAKRKIVKKWGEERF